MEKTKFKESVIMVDADYADAVSGAMLEQIAKEQNRPMVRADLADWIVTIAGDSDADETQVVFVHSRGMKTFQNFNPQALADIDGQAFMDDFAGEFLISCIPDESPETTSDFFVQCAEVIVAAEEVQNIIMVANTQRYGDLLNEVIKDSKKNIRTISW